MTHRTSLAVQWLRPHLPIQVVQVLSLVRELRYYMPQGQKNQNIKHKQLKKKKRKWPTEQDLQCHTSRSARNAECLGPPEDILTQNLHLN